MISEMVLATEPLATDVARVRPLVSVRALVDEKIVGLGEMAATEPTDILFLGAVKKGGEDFICMLV